MSSADRMGRTLYEWERWVGLANGVRWIVPPPLDADRRSMDMRSSNSLRRTPRAPFAISGHHCPLISNYFQFSIQPCCPPSARDQRRAAERSDRCIALLASGTIARAPVQHTVANYFSGRSQRLRPVASASAHGCMSGGSTPNAFKHAHTCSP